MNTCVLEYFLYSTVVSAPKMYSVFFRQMERSSFSAWLYKEAIGLIFSAFLLCTSLLLLVGGVSIDGEKKRCLMDVKCIESSFKWKTKSRVTSDNNKELEKLILPFGRSFPLQCCVSMAGRIPASIQEREVSSYVRCYTFCNACDHTAPCNLLCLSDMRSFSMKIYCEFPLCTSEARLGLSSSQCTTFLFHPAKNGKSPSMALEDAVGSPR